MPVEFEEYKKEAQRFSPTGRALGRVPAVSTKRPSSILGFLIALKLAKNEDHAKFILLLIIIIAIGLTIFFSLKTYQYLNPDINTAPIDLSQMQG